MNIMRKYPLILGLVGVVVLVLIIKSRSHRHLPGRYEEAGRSIDEKLKESKAAIENATSHVAAVFEKMGSRKS